MRQQYIPNEHTHQLFKRALNDEYGHIYRIQSGGGIGGFLKKMFNFVVPIGKTVLHKGFELIKPELSKIATKGFDAVGNYAAKQIQKGSEQAQQKIASVGKKRKRDTLS